MQRLAVLNLVGLTRELIGPSTPRLKTFAAEKGLVPVRPLFPALTCPVQATYLTGLPPQSHGIVANGWYDRALAEVHFWKQSNHLVTGKKVWEAVREVAPGATVAKLFWWYNMYSTADYSITPRPIYRADGGKIFDIYSWPFSIRAEIKKSLGEFPFPAFWGPAAGRDTPQAPADGATRWIADSARWIEQRYEPTLSLVYLPHLDYPLQRLGPLHPEVPADLARVDSMVGALIDFYHSRSIRVLVLSEYGIAAVSQPVHLNRIFRRKGWITLKEELATEILDGGASKVFAVADHQMAHVYLNDPTLEHQVQEVLANTPGIEKIFRRSDPHAALNHPRAGDFIVSASPNAWFSYYYWEEDAKAPDFARTVDIHRKPGYDPVELFIDPDLRWPKLKIAGRLLQKKLGFRMLMDLIPLDATLVKGSHGRYSEALENAPVLLGAGDLVSGAALQPTEVFGLIYQAVVGRDLPGGGKAED